MRRLMYAAFVAITLIGSSSGAQMMARVGGVVGTGLGDWGRTTGLTVGLDEIRPTTLPGWLSVTVNAGRRSAELASSSGVNDFIIVAAPDTFAFGNDFSSTWITVGARYEPAARSLGYRQTSTSLVSPFVAVSAGYARFDHDQRIRGYALSGAQSGHGIPVVTSVGVLLGRGGPRSDVLDPRYASSRYLGVEIALDAMTTLWVRNRELIPQGGGITSTVSAPTWPTLMLRLTFMYRTLPLRGES